MSRLCIVFILALIYCPAHAGDASADIGIEVTVAPSNNLLPGTEGTISITITNSGPDMATALFQWFPTENGMGFGFPPIAFTGMVTGPCELSPVGEPIPGDNFGFWITNDIGPGTSRVCNFEFRALETPNFGQAARWLLFVIDGDDPDPSNNEFEVFLVFSEISSIHPIPLLSTFGLIALALLLVLIVLPFRRLLERPYKL